MIMTINNNKNDNNNNNDIIKISIIIMIIIKIIIITILIGSDKCRLYSFANINQRCVAFFFEPGQTKQLIMLIWVFYYA